MGYKLLFDSGLMSSQIFDVEVFVDKDDLHLFRRGKEQQEILLAGKQSLIGEHLRTIEALQLRLEEQGPKVLDGLHLQLRMEEQERQLREHRISIAELQARLHESERQLMAERTLHEAIIQQNNERIHQERVAADRTKALTAEATATGADRLELANADLRVHQMS